MKSCTFGVEQNWPKIFSSGEKFTNIMYASLSRHSSTSIEAFPCLVYCQANLDGHCPLDSIEAKQVSGRQSHEWASQPCVYLVINSFLKKNANGERSVVLLPTWVSEWGPKPTLPESNDVFLCWVTHNCHWRNNDHTLDQTGTWIVLDHTGTWIVYLATLALE